jgi:GH15 family glucan-1,4-alpha-glucosidase
MRGPTRRWAANAEAIASEVQRNGWDPARGTFTAVYGTPELDASLLLLPKVGFLPGDDPRVLATIRAIEAELVDDAGLVHRYRTGDGADGLEGGEGAFLACSFWLVDALGGAGRTGEAADLFERLLGLRNDVGLLAEEHDPASGHQLGNFPQAFSHLALVSSALALSDQGERRGPGDTVHLSATSDGSLALQGREEERRGDSVPLREPILGLCHTCRR